MRYGRLLGSSALLSMFLAGLAVAADFAGTYQGANITLQLTPATGGYSGTLTLQGTAYPVTAKENAGKLAGSFVSNGASFDFDASLKGDLLTLHSADQSYELKRDPHPATQPAKAAWEKVTKAQIDSITYDDLPDDNSTTTPLAPDLTSLDDCGKKRMDNFNDALGDWAPAKVEDIPQRIRNLLSICAVADIAEDQNEAHIPYIVFTYLKSTIPRAQLVNALAYVILNDKDGKVFTNVKDIKELNIDAEIQEDGSRERSTLYAKKLLFRLLGKKPAN